MKPTTVPGSLILLILLLAFPVHAACQAAKTDLDGGLRRAGLFGASLSRPKAGAGRDVREVTAGVAATAGVQPGDRIHRLNGRVLNSGLDVDDTVAAIRAGDSVVFEVIRKGRQLLLHGVAPPVPKERMPGVSTTYGFIVTGAGQRLRTITTRPMSTDGKLPAVLLVGWLSCNTVELPPTDPPPFQRVLQAVATETDMVFMRVDKPGVGDSDGICSKADFESELSGYQAALKALKADPGVLADKVFIFGMSNGGGFAPLVGNGQGVAGYVVQGAWVKTWFEHMVEHERRRLTLSGLGPAAVSDRMKGLSEMHALFLLDGMTPSEFIKQRSKLRDIWYGEENTLYGRPASFHQQLQQLNLAEAWGRVSVPVLVVHGEYDWIMSKDDPEMIAGIVNASRPGLASMATIPRMGHGFADFASPQKAFANQDGTYDVAAAKLIVDWLGKHSH